MEMPIVNDWKKYFFGNRNEGLGSSYERIILNRKLIEIKDTFGVKSCLEAPCFGFTGMSGINSMELAREGVAVSLADHDAERLQLIQDVWAKVNLEVNVQHSKDYTALSFKDKGVDLSWNFAAIWFVPDLTCFLKELVRVTRKAILIGVPNRLGMGYIAQKYFCGKTTSVSLNEDAIVPKNIIGEMKKLDWSVTEQNYIDAPPWPDIFMKKEEFLARFGIRLKAKQGKELCIMDYYSGKDPHFKDDMMKYYWFEKNAPNVIKRFWAHHRYFLFEPAQGQ